VLWLINTLLKLLHLSPQYHFTIYKQYDFKTFDIINFTICAINGIRKHKNTKYAMYTNAGEKTHLIICFI